LEQLYGKNQEQTQDTKRETLKDCIKIKLKIKLPLLLAYFGTKIHRYCEKKQIGVLTLEVESIQW
jgi:hypothetical protein